MNPVIKFTTLFGLLAAELALSLTSQQGNSTLTHILAAIFLAISGSQVRRSSSTAWSAGRPRNAVA